MENKKQKDNKKQVETDINRTVELPSNPLTIKFSRFYTKVQRQGLENYQKEIHTKKNKVFRGVR